jgi:ABC-type antimicrobial peptide transport system permease subunit
VVSLVRSSLRHYRGLHALVIAGVAVAVSVLAGALLVGASVRASLRELALGRLGAADIVLSASTTFREELGRDLGASLGPVVPMVAVTGAVTHEGSRRTAARVQVFGIDDRFLAFHGAGTGAPTGREAWMSGALAQELGAAAGDALLLRVAQITDVPLSHVQGRREDVSERVRVTTTRVLDRASLGEFSLIPSQGPALSVFVALSRLQQDLRIAGRANALLIHVADPSGDATRDLEAARAQVAAVVQLDDLGLTVRTDTTRRAVVLESRAGVLPDSVVRAVGGADSHTAPTMGVLAYLANAIRVGSREVPYSLVAAMDLTGYERLTGVTPIAVPLPLRPASIGAAPPSAQTAEPPIWLNEWAAADLSASIGNRVELDFFLWSDQDGLQTRSAAFRLAGVVSMTGAGGDRTLTPQYPGITDAADVTSWDPPFPVDMRRVRKVDEEYWDRWGPSPKAFIPLAQGQRLWPSAFGSISSLRTRAEPQDAAGERAWPPMSALDPFAAGLTARHARAEALAAADGTTDFGQYFVYFSFFIVAAGLLLAALFFALSVEQRASELGLLMAVGFRRRDVQRLALAEAAMLAGIGSAIGMAGAVGYAALIMYGLRTWWVSAVGTTALRLHVDPWLLLAGAAGAVMAAVAALWVSTRRATAQSARTLLTSGVIDRPFSTTGARVARLIAKLALALAVALMATGATTPSSQVGAFFGAGGLLLVAGCAAFAVVLRRSERRSAPARTVALFGASYARWRPTRSVLSAALIAFACFVIVSVGAFRKDRVGASLGREAGTGGFRLMAESVAPLMHNPNTPSGRGELSLDGFPELERTATARFRLRPGDEASCLTLYQPTNPRIVAPESSFLTENRFTFARSLAETDAERANPWLLLNRRFDDGAIPAIADQTTLTYVFHLGVGDDFVLPSDGTAIRLRIVGALADSVLQSELIIGEHDFARHFPEHEGYRIWMVEVSETDATNVTTLLEDRLSDFGVDVMDTGVRLASYHQVENTYLSTFQALGTLGLLLGTFGLAAVLARNVLERRRELGVLGAVGFRATDLRTMVTAESAVIVGSGVSIGSVAAIVAVLPALGARMERVPVLGLVVLLGAVVGAGLLACVVAARLAMSTRVVEALKSE